MQHTQSMPLKGVWTLSRQLLRRKGDLHQHDREPWRERKKHIAKQKTMGIVSTNHGIDWFQIFMTNHVPNVLVGLK